jgi:hypothetical protein
MNGATLTADFSDKLITAIVLIPLKIGSWIFTA